MFRRWNEDVPPIGCDLTGDAVRLAQVDPDGGPPKMAHGLLPGGADAGPHTATKLLRDLVRAGGFRGHRVVTAVGGDTLWCRTTRLPAVSDNELSSAGHF